jgi:hypothetical protein
MYFLYFVVRISMSFPTLLTSESDVILNGTNWIINGFTTAGTHSPHTLLIAIAITDMVLPHSGRMCIYEKSHIQLQNEVKQQIERKCNAFSLPYASPGKPTLTDPNKVLI